MADKITWADKVSLVTDPTIAEINKVTDNNMNEIKSVTNTNADELAEKIVYDENDITENTSMIIEEIPEGSNIPYINSEIAIGSSNNNNIPVWFKQGKNLFSSALELGTFTNEGVKSNSTTNYRNATPIQVQPNTTYTFSINGVSQKYAVYYYNSSLTFINSDGLTTGTFTTPANCYYINFRCFNADFTSDYANLKLQLELGATATSYEAYVNTSINIDEQEIYNKPVVLVTTQNVTYDSSSQDGSAVFTLQFPTGFNASNTIVVALGWKYHSDTNNEWRFGTIAGSDVKPNPFFVTFNYNNTPGIRVRFDDVEAEVTYSADFKIVLMKVE